MKPLGATSFASSTVPRRFISKALWKRGEVFEIGLSSSLVRGS
jgi:hypothetical protein